MTDRPADQAEQGPLARAARAFLLLTIFSLGLMRPTFAVAGTLVVPTDLLFPLLGMLWLAALLAGQVRFRWEPGYGIVLAYLVALALSMLVSADLLKSGVKMLTQLYLAGLAFLACSLTRNAADLRRNLFAWLAATGVIIAVGLLSLILFWLDPLNPILGYTRFHFGTLPPGPYPRFRLTFLNANMLCNYLSVSLMILLAARRLRWLEAAPFWMLLAGIALCAALTISPGLGGILLVGGAWLWLLLRETRRRAGGLALAAGVGAALLFIPAMAVTPILHLTAPYLIEVPGTGLVLAPAGRMLTWTAAAREFAAHPWLGHGIGLDAVLVRYQDPSGYFQRLTDAHNTFLNIAAQGGIVGLAAMLLLLAYVLRNARPFRLLPDDRNVLRLALGLAFLGAFAYQGLGGSFEDARYLWMLLGLFMAAIRLERSGRAA